MDKVQKYENGIWPRRAGSSTSCVEKIELARSRGIPLEPLSLSQRGIFSIVAPLKDSELAARRKVGTRWSQDSIRLSVCLLSTESMVPFDRYVSSLHQVAW